MVETADIPNAAPAKPAPSRPTTPVPVHQAGPRSVDVDRVLNLTVTVTAILAERFMPVEAVLDITVGTIVEFDVPFDTELVLHVGNRGIGAGQAVKVGENFGLRVTSLGSVRDRIDAMGGR